MKRTKFKWKAVWRSARIHCVIVAFDSVYRSKQNKYSNDRACTVICCYEKLEIEEKIFTASVKNKDTAYKSKSHLNCGYIFHALLKEPLSRNSRSSAQLSWLSTSQEVFLVVFISYLFVGCYDDDDDHSFLPANKRKIVIMHCFFSVLMYGCSISKYLISLLHCHVVSRCWPTSIINFFHMLTTLLQR